MIGVIRPGDKVEIRIVQQIETNEATGEPVHVYTSKVEDILEDDTLEINMPIENGKVLLLPLDVRYEFVFFCNSSLYRARGVIVERYKRDNIYILRIEFKSQLKKYQRREYYRYPCLLDVNYIILDKEEWETKSSNQLFREIISKQKNRVKEGKVLDLSGGGMRFTTNENLEDEEFVMMILQLSNESMDRNYALMGRMIASDPATNRKNLYVNRVQFVFRDIKVREEIIRYIFEEERNNRNRNNF